MPRRPILAAAIALLLACRSGSQPYRGLSVATTTPPSSLLRLVAAGGTAELYHLPRLDPWGWKAATPLPPLRRPIGADLDLGVVYSLTSKSEVLGFDLVTARPRPQLTTGVRDVAVGPDGTLFVVDDSLRVVQYVRRNPQRFEAKLPARPRDLYGTRNASLLAVSGAQPTTLTVLSTDDQPAKIPLPAGDAAATFWGDLIAVAADTAVVLVDPDHADRLRSIPVSGHARAVIFSPSGHRFYVARREGPVLVYNRFTREKIDEIKLPGPAASLRADPFGRWLMVHPQGGDSLWLVDLARNRFVRGFAADWAVDLPTVTNQQTLLLKQGGDVVAFDLTRPEIPETGRVKGGAADYWLPLAWTPETGTASVGSEPAADTTATGDSTSEDATRVYLQVSSSQNKAWSSELARQLSQQGLPASVLDPHGPDEGFRVVLGPYPTREAAESAGKRLGRPFFIYQPDR
ncbi:MAG TPA: SPOR domain-containing protein [Gemmatimonadales bacterium]|nr:SPOR domain-containing protein [Gemmatimonadales bacterium]